MVQGARLVFGVQTPEALGSSLAVIQVPENVVPPHLSHNSRKEGKKGSTFPAGIWNSQSGKFPCPEAKVVRFRLLFPGRC